jgi:Ca2+/Na+ antiporter
MGGSIIAFSMFVTLIATFVLLSIIELIAKAYYENKISRSAYFMMLLICILLSITLNNVLIDSAHSALDA